MSPARPGSSGGYLDENDPSHRRNQPLGAALGRDDDDDPAGTPDAFDAPFDDLRAKLSDMTKELGSLIDTDDAPESVPVAEQADIDLDPAPAETPSGMSRLAGLAEVAAVDEVDEVDATDEPVTAADRIALTLSADDDPDDDALDLPELDAADEAFEAPELLGQQVLQANLDGDVNDNNIVDHFEDDLPADDDVDGDDGGLEFASLDFDGD